MDHCFHINLHIIRERRIRDDILWSTSIILPQIITAIFSLMSTYDVTLLAWTFAQN